MNSNDNFDGNRLMHLCAFFVESLSLYTQSIVRQSICMIRRNLEDHQIAELFDIISDKLADYPFLKFVFFVSVLISAIPVVLFIVFGITSFLLTFMGFLFIEGTLLAIGGLCMLFFILTVILPLSLIAMLAGGFYFLLLKLFQRADNSFSYSRFIRFLRHEYQIEEMSNMMTEIHQD